MTTDEILRAVRGAPDGMTARQLADQFGIEPNAASVRLSKLADYGRLDREYVKGHSGKAPTRWSIYRLKGAANAR